jgi:hypothetical protein
VAALNRICAVAMRESRMPFCDPRRQCSWRCPQRTIPLHGRGSHARAIWGGGGNKRSGGSEG